MTRTNRPTTGRTTFHHDGTVTTWDCVLGQWVRGNNPCAGLLATMDRRERARVIRHTGTDG